MPYTTEIAEEKLEIPQVFKLKRQRIATIYSTTGKRHREVVGYRRGKYSRFKFPKGKPSDIALDATLRAAAARRVRQSTRKLQVQPQDLREKVRRHRSPYVIAFVVDNSYSIHVETTLERTKGVVLELLRDAHIHHDKVALVTFRHSRRAEAVVCLPPTTSYVLALERLRKIPLSGSTPLPDGIRKAYHLLRQERIKYHNAIPVMVIISDGLPNIPIQPGANPYEEVAMLCRHLHWENISTIIVDTEPIGSAANRSNCRQMAALSQGKYLTLRQLTHQSIVQALRFENEGKPSPPSPLPREGNTPEEIP